MLAADSWPYAEHMLRAQQQMFNSNRLSILPAKYCWCQQDVTASELFMLRNSMLSVPERTHRVQDSQPIQRNETRCAAQKHSRLCEAFPHFYSSECVLLQAFSCLMKCSLSCELTARQGEYAPKFRLANKCAVVQWPLGYCRTNLTAITSVITFTGQALWELHQNQSMFVIAGQFEGSMRSCHAPARPVCYLSCCSPDVLLV